MRGAGIATNGTTTNGTTVGAIHSYFTGGQSRRRTRDVGKARQEVEQHGRPDASGWRPK
jgi:hypothetical protein